MLFVAIFYIIFPSFFCASDVIFEYINATPKFSVFVINEIHACMHGILLPFAADADSSKQVKKKKTEK